LYGRGLALQDVVQIDDGRIRQARNALADAQVRPVDLRALQRDARLQRSVVEADMQERRSDRAQRVGKAGERSRNRASQTREVDVGGDAVRTRRSVRVQQMVQRTVTDDVRSDAVAGSGC